MAKVIKYNNIKAVLAKQGLSSKALALHLKINKSTVSRWNMQLSQPSIETFHEIAGFAKVSVYELIVEEITEIDLDDFSEDED